MPGNQDQEVPERTRDLRVLTARQTLETAGSFCVGINGREGVFPVDTKDTSTTELGSFRNIVYIGKFKELTS